MFEDMSGEIDLPRFFIVAVTPSTTILGEKGVFSSYGAMPSNWDNPNLPSGAWSTDPNDAYKNQTGLPSEITDKSACLFWHIRSSATASSFRIMFLMYATSAGTRTLYVNMYRSSWMSDWVKVSLT